MSITQKVSLVEALFSQLEKETNTFQEATGLGCASGCGKCCTYPNVEASPLEFLPWALHLFTNGDAEKTLAVLKEINTPTCFIFESFSSGNKGRCTQYKYRGLICRLFGFGANTDKYGNLRLATCKIIKEGQAEHYASASEAITKGLHVPVFTEYYMQLNSIDFHLGNLILPVNKALTRALEEVLQYYAYRPSVELGENCG